uniref:LITAF domain-containing protein n=1 Tax=Acrobeloides nanus TaxID=290746 RepID=A0A914CAC7_9BILA
MDNHNSPPPPYSEAPPLTVKGSIPDPSVTFPPPPQFPSPPYPPQPPTQQPQPRIITARTPPFGPFPVEMDCPYCQNHIVTHTTNIAGALPWIILVVCAVLGFFLLIPWCLCCLPFCIDSCLDVLHTCPSCKRAVGRFSRL